MLISRLGEEDLLTSQVGLDKAAVIDSVLSAVVEERYVVLEFVESLWGRRGGSGGSP